MANGAESLGKIGLTHNVGKRESARQDLATMGQLVQLKKQQDQEEQQAALMEQQHYEQIRKEADQMLAGDRKRINERSKSIQGQIREQIKAFGGSRQKFMAQGGLAMIGDYTKNVLESEEVAVYKNNKKNLETLLDIKTKGLGSRISARDQLSLQEYNENGSGTITYSGIKNEVDMPPSDSIYFGETATGSQILFYKDNYMKILGNYKIDNPNKNIETMPLAKQQAELLSYSLAEGWLQRGTRAKPQPQFLGNKDSGSGKGKDPSNEALKLATKTGEIRVHLAKFNKNIPLSEMSNQTISEKAYLNNVFGGVTYNKSAKVEATIGEKTMKTIADITTLGISSLFDWNQNNTYIPRGASDLGKNMANPLFKTQNGDFDIKPGGIIEDFVPDSENFFLANGVPVKSTDMKEGQYRITGSFMGYEINAKNGNYLVVDAVDNDGKLDTERNESLYKTDQGEEPRGKQSLFISMQDSDGNGYYQKVDMNGYEQESTLADYIGKEQNQLGDQYTEADANRDLYDELGQKVTIQEKGKAELEVPNDIFNNSSDFQNMVGAYNKWGDSIMRSDLMKGFYMAAFDFGTQGENANPNLNLDGMINKNQFGVFLEDLGLDTRIQDLRLSDNDLLDLMQDRILSEAHSTTPEEKSNNMLLITKIRNYMSKARSAQN
jgi:hypothetical protein